MVFLLSYAPASPAPASASLVPFRQEWVGWDGSVWDISTGSRGVLLTLDGLVGMHMPKFDKYRSQSRALPGFRGRGSRAVGRSVVWPLFIHGETSEQWLESDVDFWHSIHPDLEGVWRVQSPRGIRELRLTGAFDSNHAYDRDPLKIGWARYAVELEAAQPYWSGTPIEQEFWAPDDPVDFFGAGAPPFTIGRGSTFATATMSNPGDVAAYPVWTVTGPLTTIQVGVGGVVVDVPFDLADGEVLVIDTDPRNQTATLDGVDVTATLGFQAFAPVGPGAAQSLSIVASGAGSVRVSLVPLFFRAF